ncbi:MAG: YaaL family protein [Clostridiales bacterium]|jgi:predicted transcriptional regulator|nr:YaaL family protein [Clostridiales bacterium]
MSAEVLLTNHLVTEKKRNIKQMKKKDTPIAQEDLEVLSALEKIKRDLAFVHQNLEYATHPALIDSYIYEIKSLHLRYQFYIRLCKEKGLASQWLS